MDQVPRTSAEHGKADEHHEQAEETGGAQLLKPGGEGHRSDNRTYRAVPAGVDGRPEN
jgi:hypothetical protein